jgi:hypothetical protein
MVTGGPISAMGHSVVTPDATRTRGMTATASSEASIAMR